MGWHIRLSWELLPQNVAREPLVPTVARTLILCSSFLDRTYSFPCFAGKWRPWNA
jgi:hypothetical protein